MRAILVIQFVCVFMCLFSKAVRQAPWCGRQKSHKQWGLINCGGCNLNLWKSLFLSVQSPRSRAASLSVLLFLATSPLSRVTAKEAGTALALSTLCHLPVNPSLMPSLHLCLSLPQKGRWRKESLIRARAKGAPHHLGSGASSHTTLYLCKLTRFYVNARVLAQGIKLLPPPILPLSFPIFVVLHPSPFDPRKPIWLYCLFL